MRTEQEIRSELSTLASMINKCLKADSKDYDSELCRWFEGRMNALLWVLRE